MKTLLFLLFVAFVVSSCYEDHRRPHRNLEKKNAPEKVADRPPCPECDPCPPCPPAGPVTTIIIPDNEQTAVGTFMDIVNAAGKDGPERDALWKFLAEKHPETQEGSWTLYHEQGELYYIIKGN